MPRKAIDRTGKRYGKLTVIEHAGKRGYVALWRCKCDCGNEKTIIGANLGITTSCGCARNKWKGKGSRPHYARRLPPGEAALNYAYSNHKGGARDRRLEQDASYTLTFGPISGCPSFRRVLLRVSLVPCATFVVAIGII